MRAGLGARERLLVYAFSERGGLLLVVPRAGGKILRFELGMTEPELAAETAAIGEMGREELRRQTDGVSKEMEGLTHRLWHLAGEKERMEAVLQRLNGKFEFEQVRAGMMGEEELSYLTGYIPAKRTDALKRAAADNGWALLIDDPAEDDPVPTLVENPRWIRIISPMFKLMDTTPGYREFDISFLWLHNLPSKTTRLFNARVAHMF